MLKTLKQLYRANLITPIGLYKLIGAFTKSGVNLMALLRFSARLYPDKMAIVDDSEELTYGELLKQSEQLSNGLRTKFGVTSGQKIAIICRNHGYLIRSLFAVSQCGADIYLLNAEMSAAQFNSLIIAHAFHAVIYDDEIKGLIDQSGFKRYTIPSLHESRPSIASMATEQTAKYEKVKRARSGKIVILTGGTGGSFKTAERKTAVTSFLMPFFELTNKLNLPAYKSVYIATPVYHGFGLATVFMSVALGVKMVFNRKFDAASVCKLISEQKIEVVTLVPVMLSRLLSADAKSLASLECIICGGASLHPALVEDTFSKLGDKLFNLYGTSEAGVCIMATPADLRHALSTIGKPIPGVNVQIVDSLNSRVADGSTGRICISSSWTANSGKLIDTGDIGYRDSHGYYFLCGRADDMIVSGGENVYPLELEHILLQHKDISQAAVIGIDDAEFGQRLKAFVVLAGGSTIDHDAIMRWLSGRAARYQMPKQIEFLSDIPCTSLGKPDKKALV